jgi:predicted N-acetyltransferase YhbS
MIFVVPGLNQLFKPQIEKDGSIMMNIEIRLERPDDFRETETLTRDAFWDIYKPGCDEHLLLHKLRKVPAFIPELDFVACEGKRIIGNIIYSRARVEDFQGREHALLCMGPLSVLPAYQGKGIGSLLMRHSIGRARAAGYNAVIIFGNPDYYHRFGFRNAKEYNIQTSEGQNFEAFMALELYPGSLNGVEGKYYEDPVFHISTEELELFEKEFPYREKHVTETQLK